MQQLISFFVFIACISSFPFGTSNPLSISGCVLSLGADLSPVIVRTGQTDFIYSNIDDSNLNLASGDSIDLVCPGKKVNAGSASYDNFTTATCVSDSTLEIDGENIQWNAIGCSSTAWRVARFTGNTCENNGKEAEIGFAIEDRFLRTIQLCFDESRQQALYSHTTITASINQRNNKVARPSWLQNADLFDIPSVNSHYIRAAQRTTVNTALGLPATSTKYIQDNNDNFLSRGHFTARSDNFYPAQQNVSFFLLNVAPQWQSCNGYNWETVEIYIRDYAEANKVDLLEWTGGYGVTTLPHEDTGEAVELYLYNADGRKALPVPEFYWKIAYEPTSQKGIVFIVINNPYLSTYEPVCEDVSSQVEGLGWDKEDQQQGFGYICTVTSFTKVVTYLPQFVDEGLLL